MELYERIYVSMEYQLGNKIIQDYDYSSFDSAELIKPFINRVVNLMNVKADVFCLNQSVIGISWCGLATHASDIVLTQCDK